MPITLVTGLPGHGKTLYALSRWKGEAERDSRAVFHNGIPGLTLTWQEWDALRWFELPAGALMIIDECQRVFPIRGRGAEVPRHVRELETHRHLGLDLVLITQDPMLIDPHVRRLVDRHFHIVRKFGTHWATVHEYANGARDMVSKSRGDSIKHEWRYPRAAFEWYRSAEVHTVKRRVPMRVFVLAAVPLVILGAVWAFVSRHEARVEGESAGGAEAEADAPRSLAGGAGVQVGGGTDGPVSARDYVQLHQARVPGLAHTAPVYDAIVQPVTAPYPAACVASGPRCLCWSQQATRLAVGDALCRSIVERGFFVSWETGVRPQGAEPVPAAAVGGGDGG